MKRITIAVPETLADAIQREARRSGESVSAIGRRAFNKLLGTNAEKKKLAFVGLGQSGTSDTARRVDEILNEECGR